MNHRGRGQVVTDLRRTLREAADTLVVEDRDFDATRPAAVERVPRRSPSRARWLVVIAALLIVVFGIAVVVSRPTSSTRHAVHVVTAPTTVTRPATRAEVRVDSPVLAPSFVPPGETLWSFATQRGSDIDQRYAQLIGLPHTGSLTSAILVTFQAESGPQVPTGADAYGTAVTVRGKPGRAAAPKNPGAATVAIEWDESNALVIATVRGISTPDALRLLARLQPAGTSLAGSGYTEASVPEPYRMLDNVPPKNPAGATATYGYWSATPTPGSTPDVTIATTRHADSSIYLDTAISGAIDAGGAAMRYDPFDGGIVQLVEPDGASVEVVSQKPFPRATLERVAHSAVLFDTARADDLRGQVDARLERLPAIESTRLTLGTVTLRGAGSPVTVCFTPSSRDSTACSPVPVSSGGSYGAASYDQLYAGVVAPTGWIVFAATTTPITFDGLDPQHATLGRRQVLVARVPASVDKITVKAPGLVPHAPPMSLGYLTRPAAG